MFNKKISDDARYIYSVLSSINIPLSFDFTSTAIVLGNRTWSVELEEDVYILYSAKHADIHIGATNPLAGKTLLCLILSEEYNYLSILDPTKFIAECKHRYVLPEDIFCVKLLAEWINIPYILTMTKNNTYTFELEAESITISAQRLSIVNSDGQMVATVCLPIDENILQHRIFQRYHKTEHVTPTKASNVETNLFKTEKPVAPKLEEYSFSFNIKATIPITVKAADYSTAAQLAIKSIASKSLEDIDYEIVDSTNMRKPDEA